MRYDGSQDRASYRKTTALASMAAIAAAAAGLALAGLVDAALPRAVGLLMVVAALLPLAVAASGRLVLARLARLERGEGDLFIESNLPRRENAIARPDGFRAGGFRRWLARLALGHDHLVGDEVEIRSLDEILATLDERGCLDGLPFQAEMARFCGRRGLVFRSIDKIYDYGRTRQMRRLDGCVLVSGLRCDGSEHGQCQALCYMIWKVEWLRRPGEAPRTAGAVGRAVAPAQVPGAAPDGTPRQRYLCQFTELHAASTPMSAWSVGKELRPLIAGNVTISTWLVGLGTRLFNLVQAARGGSAFPPMPKRGGAPVVEPERLAVGDEVVVRDLYEIAGTLNEKNKHRGLWFDRDQIKHCGASYKVLSRVDQIIDDVYGQMIPMKTPCILLEGVDYSGEVLNFNAQHDLFFWREVWLRKRG
jgi:hypothetical protein